MKAGRAMKVGAGGRNHKKGQWEGQQTYTQNSLAGAHLKGQLGVLANARLSPWPLGCKEIKKRTHSRKKKGNFKLTARSCSRITGGSTASFLRLGRQVGGLCLRQHFHSLTYKMETYTEKSRKEKRVLATSC